MEEERNYQKHITSTNRALSELQNAFRGSQFEGELNSKAQRINLLTNINNEMNLDHNSRSKIGRTIPNRLSAAKQLKLDKIPVEEVSLPYKGYNTISDLLWFN